MRLVRLFKVRSHLCQHLIGRDPHIDRKTKMAVNIVADIGRAFFRRRKTGSNGSIVQVTFIHTDLFNFRCQRAQKTDKLFAVAAVRVVVRGNDGERRTFFQSICHRFRSMDMVSIFR